MLTGSLGVVQGPDSRGYLEIQRLGLSGWSAVKKNGMRLVWDHAPEFLRSEGSTYSRPVVRGEANLSGDGSPPGSVSPVRQREAGEGAVVGGQPVLHKAVGVVCGATLPGNDGQGRRERAQAGLEDGEEPGEGVYAGTAPAHGDTGPQSHRH